MFIIDQLEHGNDGVYGHKVLAKLPLKECLKKKPRDYDISEKVFGFWPVICRSEDINKPSYYWDDDEERWVKSARSTPRKTVPNKKVIALEACKAYLEDIDVTYGVRDGKRTENPLYVQICEALKSS